jgi:hypothetical protein
MGRIAVRDLAASQGMDEVIIADLSWPNIPIRYAARGYDGPSWARQW